MELNICHLYPDILNLYGDRGNIITMKRRLESRGIRANIDECSIGQPLDIDKYDIFFIGGGQDFEQEVLLRDLATGKGRDICTAVEENKVFLRGRASIGDDPVGKLICEEVIPFADIPNELWLQFENQAFYESRIDDVMAALRDSDGKDRVIMYLKEERKMRRLSENWSVFAGPELFAHLYKILGEKNVKVVQKVIEKKGKVY